MNRNIIFVLLAAALLVGGFLFFQSQNKPQTHTNNPNVNQGSTTSEGKTIAGFSGKVLGGTTSPYLIFNKVDYQKALSSGKIVFLDFYANWCPICREEAPVLQEGFNSLTGTKLIGLRINWNDSDTTDDDREVANQFSIVQQHTKIILKNGKELSRTPESWDKTEFIKQMSALGVN